MNSKVNFIVNFSKICNKICKKKFPPLVYHLCINLDFSKFYKKICNKINKIFFWGFAPDTYHPSVEISIFHKLYGKF